MIKRDFFYFLISLIITLSCNSQGVKKHNFQASAYQVVHNVQELKAVLNQLQKENT